VIGLSMNHGIRARARLRRVLGITLAASIALSITVTGAPGVGVAVAQAAKSPVKPNLFNPTYRAKSTYVAPKLTHPKSTAATTTAPTPNALCKTDAYSMQPATVPITPSAASQFTSNDGRLSVAVPSGAVSAAQVAADGGSTSLLVREILPPSGSNAGGSGHFSFGTYLIQVVQANGQLATHGLSAPVTLTLQFGNDAGALDLASAYTVINGAVPPCVNLDPTSVTTSTPSAPTAKAATVQPSRATTSPQSSASPTPVATAKSDSSPSALSASVGPMSSPATTLDGTNDTLTTSAPLSSPSTSVSWGTNSAVATFGKPDPTQVDLGGGALTTSYNIDVPAGPKGVKPPLSLAYNSAGLSEQHNTQGAASWVGEGWNMTMGSISWAEHNENSKGHTPVWRDSWELSDAYGTSASLIPPASNTATYMEDSANGITPSPVQWHTAPETYAKVFSYVGTLTLPGTTVHPPCFRVFLTNGVMEEFGCTLDSLQYYPTPDGVTPFKEYVTNWFLDLITEPDGNQIHVTYQRDMVNASKGPFPSDSVLSTVEWDSPTCYNANTACTPTGTSGNLWKPLMRVNFAASHTVSHVLGSSCPPIGTHRCDDPVSVSGGMGAPTVQSDFVLNEIEVQISDDNSSTWHRLRDYQLAYDQAAPPTITDPVTGLQESVAGKFLLTQLSVIGDDNATTMPATIFGYSRHYQYYEDSLVFPNPSTNCGPAWNKGDGAGCVLWSQSYEGNSYYLASLSNGLGMSQTFTWVDNRDNMHGVPTISQSYNPLVCTNLQDNGGGNTYPCDMVDDETWSRISLSQQKNSLVRLTQAGQGGTQTSTPVDSTTNYTYTDAYPLLAQECPDCVAGYSWGNQDDNDYLDFYNGTFMGFNQVGVSNPDGSTETHHFFATEGWGVWSTSEVTGTCPASPPDTCHNDPWWDTSHQAAGQSNALHGREYQLDRYAVGGSELQQVLTTYAAICRPPWIAAGTPLVSGYGDWGANLVAELDPANPIGVCDIQTTQVDNKTIDGSTNPSLPDQTTTYTYETGAPGCTTCFGRVTRQATTSNDGGSPTTIATATTYIWNDSATTTSGHVTATSATGPYLVSFPAFVDKEDATGSSRYQCTYNGYDQLASGATGQNSGLTRADLTRQDRYTYCGTAAQSYNDRTGPITTTSGFDNGSGPYGNPWWSNDADANAGNGAHLGCTVNSVTHSACTTFDPYFQALAIGQANALNQTSSTSFQAPASATASGGFGIWPMSTTDVNGQSTTYTYDALGRQTSVTLPNETTGLTTQTMAYTVWCSGTLAQSPCAEIDRTQRLNITTTVTDRAFYDGMGQLVETRSPAPSGDIVQYYFYDSSQRLAFKSIPYLVAAYGGAAGSAAYSIPDSTVAGTSTTYDGLGRTTSVEDALSETTSSGYTVVCNPPGTGDNACYEQVLTADPLGHQSGVLTDALGRTDYAQAYTGNSSGTYALYATTKYSYDYLGDLIQILHPDGVTSTSFQYDMAGRQTGLTDPDRGVETYTYDPDGNLTESVDARGSAGTVYAGFDGIDQPIWRNTTNGPGSAYTTYTYGTTPLNFNVGRLISETFSNSPSNGLSGNYSYGYDKRGQQTSSTLTVGSTTYPSLATSFDDAGNVLTQTYPDGEKVTNSLGAQGWLSGLSTLQGSTNTTLLTNIAYSGTGGAYGFMTSATASPGGSFNFGYDLLGRLNSISDQGSGTILSEQLSFDPAGNVSTISSNLVGATDNQAFCYDEQDRLTWAASTGTAPCTGVPITTGTIPTYSQTFAYDTLGRLTSGPLGAYTYGDPAHVHAATAIGSTYSASYNASGGMACRATASTTCSTQTGAQLTYNIEGQLSNWQNPAGSTAAFLYDGQGNRVAQQTTSGGTTTTTVYTGGVEEDTSINGGQPTHTTYYYANGRRIAVAVNGTFSYLATDALGSATVAITQASPFVTATTLFAPYGSVRYSSGTMPTDHGFTGQVADSTSGLDYYGARYYDPVAGQFASADTVIPGNGLDMWGLSRYAYVEGNPVSRTDPTGHCTTEKCFLDANSSDNTTHMVPGVDKPAATSYVAPPPTSKPFSFAKPVTDKIGEFLNWATSPGVQNLNQGVAGTLDAWVDVANGMTIPGLLGNLGLGPNMNDPLAHLSVALGGSPSEAGAYRSGQSTAAVAQLGLIFTPEGAESSFVRRLPIGKPIVGDTKLASLFSQLYRPTATIGTGSTADAARSELAAGALQGGHIEKAYNYSVALQRWLENNPDAAGQDIHAAQSVLQDMLHALSGGQR
jgi:RHS repeat-associated protein